MVTTTDGIITLSSVSPNVPYNTTQSD